MNINKGWTFYRLNKPEERINVDLPYDAMLREPRDISHLGGDKVSFFKGDNYGYEKIINIAKKGLGGCTIEGEGGGAGLGVSA